MHEKLGMEFLKKPYDIIEEYINNDDNYYQILFENFMRIIKMILKELKNKNNVFYISLFKNIQ